MTEYVMMPSQLRKAFADMQDDLLIRAEIGSGGERVVNVSASVWDAFCEALDAIEAAPQQAAEPVYFIRDIGAQMWLEAPETAYRAALAMPSLCETRILYAGHPPAQPEQPAPRIYVDPDALSNYIRLIDGCHVMGAGDLAEKIAAWVSDNGLTRPAAPDGGE